MFNVSVCEQALQLLLQYVVLDELEDVDSKAKLPKGTKTVHAFIEKILKDKEASKQLIFNLGMIVGAVEQAWKQDVWNLFYHMGLLTNEEQARGLFYLVMGCMGHGIALHDEYYKQFNAACEKLKIELEGSPVYYEQSMIFTQEIERFLVYEGPRSIDTIKSVSNI